MSGKSVLQASQRNPPSSSTSGVLSQRGQARYVCNCFTSPMRRFIAWHRAACRTRFSIEFESGSPAAVLF